MAYVTSYTNLFEDVRRIENELENYSASKFESGQFHDQEVQMNILGMQNDIYLKRKEMERHGNQLKNIPLLKLATENDVDAVLDMQKHYQWQGHVTIDEELDNSTKALLKAKATDSGLNTV